jgi:TRAP-type C4-dicarboxylate transport system substrate-binding protein
MARARLAGVVLVAGLTLALVAGCRSSSSDKAGGQQAQKPRVLTMADVGAAPGELLGFAAEAARLSRGTIRIEFKGSWRLGERKPEIGAIGDIRAGKADLGWTGSRAWDSVGIKSFRALNAPLLIDSYPLEEQVVRNPLVQPMLQSLQPLGLVGLGVLPGGMRRPLGTRQPLVRPADFAGRTIAVQGSRVADETMRALGAKSVWIPAGNPNIRPFDGAETRVGFELYGSVAKGEYLAANVDLWPRPLVLFANRKVFESLTRDQQRALRQAPANVVSDQIKLDQDDDAEASGNLCRGGQLTFVSASPADLAALRRAVQPVYDELERDPGTREAIATIERLKRDSPTPPDALPACHRRGREGTGKATPIDGVYEMTTTRSAAAPDFNAGNWGKQIFAFDRGRWAYTQENKYACTWGYGTFTVTAHEMAWTVTDGGASGPNIAKNNPGELFRFGWSLYRDTLRVTPVKGAISPENVLAKPWRLISATPSRSYLSKRCHPPASALPR